MWVKNPPSCTRHPTLLNGPLSPLRICWIVYPVLVVAVASAFQEDFPEAVGEALEAEEVGAVQYSGAELEIGFNVSYLLDVLSVLEQTQVRLLLSDEASSALLENAEGPSEQEPERLYVVMPMRL